MSLEHPQVANGTVSYGNVFPSDIQQDSAIHLYISLAELVAESVFYHPSLANEDEGSLSEQEQQALKAIVGSASISEHFVSTLVTSITAKFKSQSYQSIKLCLSDADSFAYSALIGGSVAEEKETNPFMGVRGVSRYASEKYATAFSLECDIVKALRTQGIDVEIVVPFVRALSDAATIIDRLAENGLPRGLNGLKVSYSCDVPSAALLSERLLQYFDGIVINVDHLTQFTLGVDRFNEQLEHLFKPENEAVISLIDTAVKCAHIAKKDASIIYDNSATNDKFEFYLTEHCHADTIYRY
ncbi:putative PEP-binding protein [Vibrio viridaestus]|uniref:Phosphoenolpyruvate synthase n=1 Tax=Vibrio viridaestus TaxID=2487322 RepID=A0A3N9TGY8_9VIBR|nr:putative PEP-binding protein [Vibrio viridaestus]RQW63547.1 phosphoenolpyruvate synthase [Vibrio viridaestus]